MLKLKLKSDFSDWFDPCFDDEGIEFRRMTEDGPKRSQMFRIFQKIGLKTPFFGYFDTFLDYFDENALIIAHLDENAHCGEGKILKKLKDLTKVEKKCFLVQYIPTSETFLKDYKSMTKRLLFIGHRCFCLYYMSHDDWRSNCGQCEVVNISEISPCPVWRNKIFYPLFGVDFVGNDTDWLAIDLNISPGTLGTGIQQYMSAAQIVLEIKAWFKDQCKNEE